MQQERLDIRTNRTPQGGEAQKRKFFVGFVFVHTVDVGVNDLKGAR